jgi:transcription initiation factor TFIIH subunit 1
MAMIQLVANNGEKPPVFHLTGPTKQACRIELETLKSVVSDIRKGKTGDESTKEIVKSSSSSSGGAQDSANYGREKKRSKTQVMIDKNSSEYRDSVALVQKRKDLLMADKLLGKSYKELVEVSKLFTDEDFWANHTASHERFLPEDNKKNSFGKKGQLSVMLMDIEGSKNADGSHRIDLTKEKRDQIFSMYPAVRKAFEAEVPLNKTETEFWVAYFQSEYFARDKGGRMTGGDDSFGRTDDIFSRYEETENTSRNSTSRIPIPHGKNKQNLSGIVGSDVDLTAILGDYGPGDATNLGEKEANNLI